MSSEKSLKSLVSMRGLASVGDRRIITTDSFLISMEISDVPVFFLKVIAPAGLNPFREAQSAIISAFMSNPRAGGPFTAAADAGHPMRIIACVLLPLLASPVP